jgi:glutamine synthetase
LRLRPNRWAPISANIAVQDRGASIRVCPVFGQIGGAGEAQQFNVEYRVADAAASPYLALGALVWAGVDGIRHARSLPAIPERNFADAGEAGRDAAEMRPLPRSLDEALDGFAGSTAAREWFGDNFFEVYLRFKRAELRVVAGLSEAAICARYGEIY